MQLVVGNKYVITDWLHTEELMGTYRGQIQDAGNFPPIEELLLFELIEPDEGKLKLVGCQVRGRINSLNLVHSYLYATHYGNDLKSLAPRVRYRPGLPEWEMV